MRNDSLLKTAWLIAWVIVISKLIGFARDVVIANFYGASVISDAYFYAYQIPSLALILLGGVGGPFHSAAVAVFSKMIPNFEKADDKTNKLFNTFLTISFIAFMALAILVFVFADVIMGFIISGGSPDMIALAALHLKIMSPILVIGGLIGIYYGILVSYKSFLLPNFSPIVMSLIIIAAISLTSQDKTGVVLAIATTVGAIAQLLIQLPKIRKLGFRLKPNLAIFNNPEYKNIIELLFPAILSSTVGQIYIYVDMFFASHLEAGAWTAIGYANRIFQFPVGILVTAFLVPLFPIFSKLVAQKDLNGIRYYFNKGVGLLNFVAFPILVGILLLASDAVTLIFQRGAFDANATTMVTQALIFLSIAIIPYVFRDSITRIYYSFNDSKTPFLVALSSIFLKFILNWFFVKKMGIGGITLSTSLVTLVNAVLLGIFIRKKITLEYKKYFKNLLKMVVASAFCYVICLKIHQIWHVFEYDKIALLVKTFTIFTLSVFIFQILALGLKIDYAKELYDRIRRKKRK